MTSAVRPARAIPSKDYVARFAAERARLQRHYCNLFKFWRACPDKHCRRHLRCCGDAGECLKLASARFRATRSFWRGRRCWCRRRTMPAAPSARCASSCPATSSRPIRCRWR
jgi:hypothetical protein